MGKSKFYSSYIISTVSFVAMGQACNLTNNEKVFNVYNEM